MDKFVIYDNQVCFKKNGSLKQYFNLKNFDKSVQNDIVDTLNEHFQDLTVLKSPSNRNLKFLIKKIPYIEQYEENGDLKVMIHNFIKDIENFHIPVNVKQHHYVNIFSNYDLVEVWPDEYYVIKCDNSKGIYVVDKNNHIVPHFLHIFENYNIFEGKHIVVDIDTFGGAGYVKDNGLIDLDDIKRVILSKFHVSYIKKLLCKKDLKIENLRKFVEECRCKINSSIGYDGTREAIFFVIDNFGDHYEMKVNFEGGESKFYVVKKVNH